MPLKTDVVADTTTTNGFQLNSTNQYFIDTTGKTDLTDISGAKWAKLAAGISSITPSSNETTNNDAYYDGGAFGSNDVTGKRPQWAFSGHRVIGDKGQDYVASHEFAVGDALKTRFLWINTEGNMIVAEVTMLSIIVTGGNANAKQTMSFTLGANGAPVVPQGKPTLKAAEDGTYTLETLQA